MTGFIFFIELLISCFCLLKICDGLINTMILSNKRNKEKQRLEQGLIIIEHLHYLTPAEFEEWCKEFLLRLGYTDVVVTPSQADGGKDIICYRDGQKVYAECKRYSPSNYAALRVNQEVVKKLVGAMVHDGVDKGLIITTGIVDRTAYDYIELVSDQFEIEVIDGYALEHKFGEAFV